MVVHQNFLINRDIHITVFDGYAGSTAAIQLDRNLIQLEETFHPFEGQHPPLEKIVRVVGNPVRAVSDILFEFVHGDLLDIDVELFLLVLSLVGLVGVASQGFISLFLLGVFLFDGFFGPFLSGLFYALLPPVVDQAVVAVDEVGGLFQLALEDPVAELVLLDSH